MMMLVRMMMMQDAGNRPNADDAIPTKAPSIITTAKAATLTWGVSYDTKKLLEYNRLLPII